MVSSKHKNIKNGQGDSKADKARALHTADPSLVCDIPYGLQSLAECRGILNAEESVIPNQSHVLL